MGLLKTKENRSSEKCTIISLLDKKNVNDYNIFSEAKWHVRQNLKKIFGKTLIFLLHDTTERANKDAKMEVSSLSN